MNPERRNANPSNPEITHQRFMANVFYDVASSIASLDKASRDQGDIRATVRLDPGLLSSLEGIDENEEITTAVLAYFADTPKEPELPPYVALHYRSTIAPPIKGAGHAIEKETIISLLRDSRRIRTDAQISYTWSGDPEGATIGEVIYGPASLKQVLLLKSTSDAIRN